MNNTRTVDSLVKQQEEFCHGTVHLLPVEVKQGNHLKVHLSEQIGQLVHVGDGSTQLSVVLVAHVANQQSNLVRGCVCDSCSERSDVHTLCVRIPSVETYRGNSELRSTD